MNQEEQGKKIGKLLGKIMMNLIKPLLVAVALAIGPTMTWADVGAAYPTQELLSTGITVVGETVSYPSAGPARVTVSIVTIAPGAETLFHRHPVPLVAYLLEGEMTVDYGVKGKKVYRKGDAFLEAMDVAHRGMNPGTSNVRILAVYLGAEGTLNVALEK